MENKYWPLESRASKSFTRSGSDTTDSNTYTYNEYGFRGDSVYSKIDLLAVGCSHTEGIGVNDNETWPYYTAKALKVNHINAGFTGRSNDYIARTVCTYVRQFKPSIVAVMYTYSNRREYWTDQGPQPYAGQKWGYFDDNPEKWRAYSELGSTESDRNNFIKNHLIVLMACELANTRLIWNGSFLNFDYTDSKRFDGDYNIEYGVHATKKQNKKYSKKLVAVLKSNSYL